MTDGKLNSYITPCYKQEGAISRCNKNLNMLSHENTVSLTFCLYAASQPNVELSVYFAMTGNKPCIFHIL